MKIDQYVEMVWKILENQGSIFSSKDKEKMLQHILYYYPANYTNIIGDYFLNMQKNACLENKIISGFQGYIAIGKDQMSWSSGENRKGQKIKETTMFDVSSITKFYTFLLTCQLEKQHLLSFDDLLELSEGSKVSINDLFAMQGEYRTPKRIDEVSIDEAKWQLKNVYPYQKEGYKYSDIPLILISELIKQKCHAKSYEQVLQTYLLHPEDIIATYHPKGRVAGNGRKDKLCYDPKAQKLQEIGSAGLFISAKEAIKTLTQIKHILTKKQFLMLFEAKDEKQSRGYAGLYQKCSKKEYTYVPFSFTKNAFASEGSTGCVLLADYFTNIFLAAFPDAIDEKTHKKAETFHSSFEQYQEYLSQSAIELFLLQSYYENFKSKDDVKILKNNL